MRNAAGRTATLNSRAAIVGTNLSGPTVQVNAGGTLSGLTIESHFSGGSGGRTVLVADFATGVAIANNTISATQSGNNAAIALGFGGNTSGTASGNTLTVTGSGTGTMTALAANSPNTTLTVTGNSMSATGGATNNMVWLGGTTAINAGSTGNVRGAGNCNGAPASGSIGFTNGTTCP